MNFPEVQPKSVIIFWEEDDVKQLYSVLKEIHTGGATVFLPDTMIIKKLTV